MFTHNFNQNYSAQSDTLAVDCLARQFTGKLTFALLCSQWSCLVLGVKPTLYSRCHTLAFLNQHLAERDVTSDRTLDTFSLTGNGQESFGLSEF